MATNFDEKLKRAWEKRKALRLEKLRKGKSYDQLKKEESLESMKKHFKSIISVPIIIGFFAAVVMYRDFGWKSLESSLLSWTIGLTIIVTLITLVERYTKLIKF